MCAPLRIITICYLDKREYDACVQVDRSLHSISFEEIDINGFFSYNISCRTNNDYPTYVVSYSVRKFHLSRCHLGGDCVSFLARFVLIESIVFEHNIRSAPYPGLDLDAHMFGHF